MDFLNAAGYEFGHSELFSFLPRVLFALSLWPLVGFATQQSAWDYSLHFKVLFSITIRLIHSVFVLDRRILKSTSKVVFLGYLPRRLEFST